jgi:hypothetical protein
LRVRSIKWRFLNENDKPSNLRDKYNTKKAADPDAYARYEREFAIRFAHESTALSGNTLSLEECRAVIENENLIKQLNSGRDKK